MSLAHPVAMISARLSAIPVAAVLGLGLFFALPALGQQPLPVPPVPTQQRLEPVPLTPLVPAPLVAPRTPAPPERTQQVQIGQLADVDPSVAGLLDETNGGLGKAMWAGSDRERIERLLPRLPMGTLSPAIQDLARRLLLSTAAVPEGKRLTPSLLGLRVERLMAGGHIDLVNELLELAAASLDDPSLSRAEVDAMLLAGDNSGACSRVSSLVRSDPLPYWTKVLAFCRALDNDNGAVSMAVALLRDQGHVDDQAFFTLVSALAGNSTAQITSLIDPEPLHLAMLRAAQQTVPADAVAGARPAILRAIAKAPSDELGVRIEAAERAEAAGALSTNVLAEMYAAVPYTGDEIDVALQTAAADEGAKANALLYQAALFWEGDAMRATALQRAWQRTQASGTGFGTAARVSLEITRQIAPHPDLMWFAYDAGRALIAAGDYDLAWAWLEAASVEGAKENTHAAEVAYNFWPLMQMADPEGAFMRDPERFRGWWRDLPVLESTQATDNRALLYTLYEALGDALPNAAWDPLFSAPLTVTAYQPSLAVSHALREASNAGRLAETVLLALVALGDVGSEGADPATLFNVVQALRRVGLTTEARKIALEAVVARGL